MNRNFLLMLVSVITIWLGNNLLAQESQQYLLGEEQKLQIVVYVLGEVAKPGEYMVSDNTDVVKLIAKAGGTTEFSNIGKVTITRTQTAYDDNSPIRKTQKEIINFSVKDFLSNPASQTPPILQPGDVIFVKRNAWSKWRSAFTVVRDLSVVASAYFLYLRSRD